MHVALVFSTDITGRAIDVDIEWFYMRVWTISSFTVRLTKLLSVFTAKSVAQCYLKKKKYTYRWNRTRAQKQHVWCSQWFNLLSYPILILFDANIEHYDRSQFPKFLSVFWQNSTPTLKIYYLIELQEQYEQFKMQIRTL